jgi:hypothetical protein
MVVNEGIPASASAAAQITRWLVAPPGPVVEAPALVEEAVTALLGNDVNIARDRLRSINRPALWTHWFAAGAEWARRHSAAAHGVGARSAAVPTRAVARSVFERDGWRCRYCGLQVVDPKLLKALGVVLPAEFPWTGRNASSHPGGLLLAATADHVVPHSIGGDSTPSNLVTACGVCQYNKGSCTIAELGLTDPRDRRPITDDWRGLTSEVAVVSARTTVPGGIESPIDYELEYLIIYGRTTGQLPAVTHRDLVEKLVRVYEAAVPQTDG